MSELVVTFISGTSPNYGLTVQSEGLVQVGDHVLMPTLTGDGVYRVTAVSSGLVSVTDDLEPSGGTYGTPIGTSAFYATPNGDTTTPVPFGAKFWNAARNRNGQLPGNTRMKADGRFSYSAASPIHATSGGDLYYHRWNGKFLSIYNGSRFIDREIAATPVSISLGAVADGIYDVMASWSGTAIVLTLEAWGGASRVTPLQEVDGVYVSGADNTKRYLGAIKVTSNLGDELAGTSINHYNQLPRSLYVQSTAATWTHTSAGQRLSFATVAAVAARTFLQPDPRGSGSNWGLPNRMKARFFLRVQTDAGATEEFQVLQRGVSPAGVPVLVESSMDQLIVVEGELTLGPVSGEGEIELGLYETFAGAGTNTMGQVNKGGAHFEWWS